MNTKRQLKRTYNIIIIAVLLLGVFYVCSRFIHLGTIEWTDNAQVHRDITPISSRAQGFIKEIRFKEFQFVHRGDTLVILEDAQYRLALAQAEAGVKGQKSGSSAVSASINTTQSNVTVAQAGMSVASAGIEDTKVNMQNAKKDYDRFAALYKRDAVTQQQLDNARTRYESAKAQYEGAVARLSQASASRQATSVVKDEQQHRLAQQSAGVSVAQAQLNLARLNLSYTVITAPCDGYIGRKYIYEGQLVQPGQQLVSIIDQSSLRIIANYRETQMKHIQVGSAVTFEADAVPGVTFHGRVQSISAATGSAYTNAPVDNSTGNFVKVEQRVPVRIELTKDNDAADVKKLIDGLNVECEVDY